MEITKIIPKRKRLSALYIDGEFAINIDTETLLLSGFSVGSEISDEQLHKLICDADEKRCKEKALWLLSYRDHSKKELQQKLSKNAQADTAEKAVERMEELGLLNDENYARRLANELINTKHLSIKGALYKLREKGIDKELAEEILEEFDVDPQEHIEIIINKKYLKDLPTEKGKRRAVNGLQRLGYSYSDINSVLNRYSEEDYI